MRPIIVLMLCGLASPGVAATLRDSTTLDRPMVRIADLFDDAGLASDRVLGPGPAPGGRIVVEAQQLAAIARQFGVSWRANSPAARVVIDRPGRLVPREDVMTCLRAALVSAGASTDAEIDLPGFAAPLVALEAAPQPSIEQIDFDRTTGRFTASLAIATTGEPIQRMRLSGSVREMADEVVTTHRLLPGSVIGPGDLTVQRRPASPLRDGVGREAMVRDPIQAIGLAVRRMEQAGQTLPLADLSVPMMVLKGARVTMELSAPGLSLTGTGTALESGAQGARITVLNPASRAVVEAEILGPDRVRVTPDSSVRPGPRSNPNQVSQR